MSRVKRVSRLSNQVAPAVTLDRDRRRERRGPVRRSAKVEVTSGLFGGEQFDVVIRDASLAGSAFYLKESLPVGTKLRLTEIIDERPHRAFVGEVTRTRPISNGRHEMNVRYAERTDVPEVFKVLG
ncbi:MAG: PilZ domain-containing protein [Planctomycetota bacterium]